MNAKISRLTDVILLLIYVAPYVLGMLPGVHGTAVVLILVAGVGCSAFRIHRHTPPRSNHSNHGTQNIWHFGIKDIPRVIAATATLLAGALLLWAVFQLLGANTADINRALEWAPSTILVIGVLILAAYSEELFYRGVMFQFLGHYKVSQAYVVIITALVFATAHLPHGIYASIHALVAGILLAGWYSALKKIHVVALSHALINILLWTLGGRHSIL